MYDLSFLIIEDLAHTSITYKNSQHPFPQKVLNLTT